MYPVVVITLQITPRLFSYLFRNRNCSEYGPWLQKYSKLIGSQCSLGFRDFLEISNLKVRRACSARGGSVFDRDILEVKTFHFSLQENCNSLP